MKNILQEGNVKFYTVTGNIDIMGSGSILERNRTVKEQQGNHAAGLIQHVALRRMLPKALLTDEYG